MAESRQAYSEAFIRKTLMHLQEQTKTLPELAEELQIPAETLQNWLERYREMRNETEHNTGPSANLSGA